MNKKVKIFGFVIKWSHSDSRRRKKLPAKLERITTPALLDSVLKNPEMMAAIINKYGELWIQHDDELEPQLKNLRDKIYREAVQTILESRRHELESRIDGIIDYVMDTADTSKEQREVGLSPDNVTGIEGRVPVTKRRHRTREHGSKHTPSLSALLKDLEMLAALGKVVSQGIETKSGGGVGKTYAVEHNGQMVEMDESEYRSYILRRQGLPRRETRGYALDMTQPPGLPRTNKSSPVPPEKRKNDS